METEIELTAAPVTFSANALLELENLKLLHSEANQYLRVGVKGGGCSGMSYLLAYDQKQERDNEYIIHEIPVIIDKAHVMYVLGMEIDWTNGLNNRGFEFLNPNAKSTCGCGESFST